MRRRSFFASLFAVVLPVPTVAAKAQPIRLDIDFDFDPEFTTNKCFASAARAPHLCVRAALSGAPDL